jgi:hypothetical protein
VVDVDFFFLAIVGNKDHHSFDALQVHRPVSDVGPDGVGWYGDWVHPRVQLNPAIKSFRVFPAAFVIIDPDVEG